MTRRIRMILIVIIVLILIPIAWWLASPLFINRTVDEAFPFEIPSQEALANMSADEKEQVLAAAMTAMPDAETLETMPAEAKEQMETQLMQIAAEMPAKEMNDEMPAAADEWLVVAQGEFMDADSFHQGSGAAAIFQQGDTRVLRFENFQVTNGPDLHVLLVENIAGGAGEMGTYIDLGSLKGNVGNQNYEIPADVDLSQFSGVMIYCMPFHVVFATAAF